MWSPFEQLTHITYGGCEDISGHWNNCVLSRRLVLHVALTCVLIEHNEPWQFRCVHHGLAGQLKIHRYIKAIIISWRWAGDHGFYFIIIIFLNVFLIITSVDKSFFVSLPWSLNVLFCSLNIEDGRLTNRKILLSQTYFIEEDVIFCPEAYCQDVPFWRQSTECTEGKVNGDM